MRKDIQCTSQEDKSSWHEIINKVNYLWRLIVTAIGFSLFAGGGFTLCLTIFPVIILFSRDCYQRANRVRYVICYIFKIYLAILEFLGVFKVNTHGLESLSTMRGHLVICNHPSLLDVVIIMSRLNGIQCVVKNGLWSNPMIGGVVRAAGYIRNDISPELFLEECKKQLAKGENIIIFPEGTRSTPGQPLKLLRGLGNLALAAQANIQALTLDCKPTTLTKGAKWYNIPPKKAIFNLRVGPLFPSTGYLSDAPRSIRVRALMRDIQQYYDRELKI